MPLAVKWSNIHCIEDWCTPTHCGQASTERTPTENPRARGKNSSGPQPHAAAAMPAYLSKRAARLAEGAKVTFMRPCIFDS